MLECDVARRIGWYVRYPNGTNGPRHKARDDARREARGDDET
jgi:hypothetical protein